MHFAARTGFDPGNSDYGVALHAARRRGNLLDLTLSNPTRCGFTFPQGMLEPLSSPAGLLYEPDALGMQTAREAVAGMYRERHGAGIAPDNLLLTASTSEAYSYLLRLFCEPGDAVLVPSPSYPLFDLLARLHDVELQHYPLLYHDGWQIDVASLNAAVTPQTRAIVVIHPNNPTGHYCSAHDREVLLRCARTHNLPLIVDEVFLEYPVEAQPANTFFSTKWPACKTEACEPVLTFVLGGLSKMLCLPQMKVAWTAVTGPQDEVAEAVSRLEVIADTFLSVGTPPQLALPAWLSGPFNIAGQVRRRVRSNLAHLDAALTGTVVSRLRVEAAWAAILRVPALEDDEALAVRLLERFNVALHPGSFYGLPKSGWLVTSLLTAEDDMVHGIAALLAAW